MSERRDRFDALYAENIDPWNFAASAYEREKYQATLNALPRDRYNSGLEVGCSIGELTRLLSSRCDHLLGVDVSNIALEEARRRTADLPNISYQQAELPAAWPDGVFDLIVLSEVLYFLSAREIVELAERVGRALSPSGDCLLVNFTCPIDGGIQGDAAAELFLSEWETHGFEPIPLAVGAASYRIDLARKPAVMAP